ncbi:DUF1837 domain-containing protein [Mycoplasma capricolum subsp. capricolum]|uniref:HamA C-terminal domain-containing protein n=1 Tax=Mycoplasma capricolum TaxID=2095 RepID=UPI003DA5B832
MEPNKFIKHVASLFEKIKSVNISLNGSNNTLELFIFPIEDNKFNTEKIIANLQETIIAHLLDRKDYIDFFKHDEKARQRFFTINKDKYKTPDRNSGELGELLLFILLEGHLDAVKLVSKMKLKTDKEQYINGADAIHLKRIGNKKYQLIFGESKTNKDPLGKGLPEAIDSISSFLYGKNKFNGTDKFKVKEADINFERGIISSHIDTYLFEDGDEKEVLKMLKEWVYFGDFKSDILIDDAFAIFLGYECESNYIFNQNNESLWELIKNDILDTFGKIENKIKEKIISNSLDNYTFYVFVMPFPTDKKTFWEQVVG